MRDSGEIALSSRRLVWVTAAVVAVALVATITLHPTAAAETTNDASKLEASGETATFEGEAIQLDEDWGDATVCVVTENGTECFRTVEEADDSTRESSFSLLMDDGATTESMSAWCWVRLYDYTNYYGRELWLEVHNRYLNLSLWSFDNRTSSYRVGSCNSTFRSGSNGSGSTYPGDTSAWGNAPSMVSSWWDNQVSSVAIWN